VVSVSERSYCEWGWGLLCVTVTQQRLLMCRISLSVPPMMGRNDSRTVGIEPEQAVGLDAKRRGC